MSTLSVAGGAPITYQRPIKTEELEKYLDKPHVPRGSLAVDKEHPNGSVGHDTKDLSVLQQHVAFFDRNGDGIIYPWETYAGFRAVGFNVLWSFGAIFVINGAFSWATQNSWIPSPTFSIIVRNIHRAKHGSDSEVYDTEGRFVPAKFEELFSKFDHGQKNALTFFELLELTEANRNVMDPFGWTAEKLEWGLTFLLLKDSKGFVSKDSIRGMYDGSVFTVLEQQRIAAKKNKKSQ